MFEKNYMKYKNIFLSISFGLIMISFLSFFIKTPNFGIDFTGGTILQCKMDEKAPLEDIRKELKNNGINASVIKFETDKEFLVKVGLKKDVSVEKIYKILKDKYKKLELRRTQKIGAKVGEELITKGITALLLTILIILIYVSIRFEWKFAVASSLALFHDVFITAGLLNILNVSINLEILAALLTILGYSINDTIVVFDRIRENLKEKNINDLNKIINISISGTMTRTLLTSLTTLFVVFSVFVFGGDMVYGLSVTLLIGIIIGTYSSIYFASPLLILMKFSIKDWKNKLSEKEKLRKERKKQREMFENGVV